QVVVPAGSVSQTGVAPRAESARWIATPVARTSPKKAKRAARARNLLRGAFRRSHRRVQILDPGALPLVPTTLRVPTLPIRGAARPKGYSQGSKNPSAYNYAGEGAGRGD